MSYSLDTNILIYASDEDSPRHALAKAFLEARMEDPDLCCLTWPVVMGYQRIATHPSVFKAPLSPAEAWSNVSALMQLPRTVMIGEGEHFARDYEATTRPLTVKGNMVPDAHLATILRQHGVGRIYTADADLRRFDFLEVINPLAEL